MQLPPADLSAGPPAELRLRPYQEKVVRAALQQNTLAVLPTGSGKTLVAIHVIKERLRLIREKYEVDDPRRPIIAFVAPTKVLVGQQNKYILTHSDAKTLELTGETTSIDGHGKKHWNAIGWKDLLLQYEVVVMTPQVLRHLLQKHLIDANLLDTLVIDECHHAYKHDPLTIICRIIRDANAPTLILAMTASPVQCKTGSVLDQIALLEDNLGCKMLCTKEILEEYRTNAPAASLAVYRFPANTSSSFELIMAGINATHIVGTLAGSESFGFDSGKRKASRIVFPSVISVDTNPPCLLLYAYLRARHALLVKSVYSCVATMLANPSDVGELQCINLPTVSEYRNYVRGNPLPDHCPQPAAHVLDANFSSFPMLGDTLTALGQVLTIVEECGVLCGIYALILAIEDQISSKFVLKEAPRKTRKGVKNMLDGEHLAPNQTKGRGGGVGNRSSRIVPHYERESHAYIDGDKLDGMAKELACSPFKPVDLFHDQYVACLTLLDYFYALAAFLGPAVCGRAAVTFALACKKSTGTVALDVDPIELGLSPAESFGLSRMNAILYLLMKSIAKGQTQMVLTPEGCLSHITEVLQASAIFERFRLRLDVCGEAVRRACWALVRSLTVPELKTWTRMDEELRYSSFEPLMLNSVHDSDDTCMDDMELVQSMGTTDFPNLEHVSSKLKAVCHVWLEINKEADFALHWQRNQTQMVSAMMLIDQCKTESYREAARAVLEEGEIDEGEEAEMTEASPPSVRESADGSIATEPADAPTESAEASYIVFCKKRLTARSIHFVLSIILENDFGGESMEEDGSEDGDDVLDDEAGDEPNSRATCEVTACLNAVIDRVVAVEAAELSSVRQRHDSDVLSAMEGLISAVEVMVYGPGLAQRVREALLTRSISPQLIKVPMFRPVHLIGGMKQADQMQTLGNFKTGYYNIVFATDVMEEGLDVKACKYVINFDLPLNVKSFIQRKGRSRAENSMMISLIPFGGVGTKMVSELQLLLRHEKTIETYSGKPDTEESELDEFVVETKRSLTPAEAEPDDMLDGFVTTSVLSLSTGEVAVSDETGKLEGEVYTVHTTGAEVDARTAVHVLINFCQQLPHDLVFSYKPIFWMEKVPLGNTAWFRCAILLPPCVHPSIRFINGPVSRSKAQAKRSASLFAVKELHLRGELDDWLFAHGSTQAAKKGRVLAQVESAKSKGGKEKREGTAPKQSSAKKLKAKLRDSFAAQQAEGALQDDREDDEYAQEPLPGDIPAGGHLAEHAVVLDDEDIADFNLVKILVKTIPDLLTLPAATRVENGVRLHELFFYCSTGEFLNKRCRTITMDCTSCVSYFQGINLAGAAFARELPAEVLAEPFRCQIRENETIFVDVHFVQSRWVSDEELAHIQRFHRGVLCWETDELLHADESQFSDDLWLPHDAVLSHDALVVTEHDAWRASSGGSWYVVYPPPHLPDIEAMYCSQEGMNVPIDRKLRGYSDAFRSTEWLPYLVRAADEAQVLAHNLRVQELLNRSDAGTYTGRQVHSTVPFEELVGMIVVRGVGGLSYVHADNINPSFYEDSSKVKRVGDVMKYVPDFVREEVFSVLEVMLEVVEAKEAPVTAETAGASSLKRRISWDASGANESNGRTKKAKGADGSVIATATRPGSTTAASAGMDDPDGGARSTKARNPLTSRALTFADNILLKYPESCEVMERWKADPTHRLAKIVPISSVLTLANLIGKFILHLKRPPEIVALYGRFLQSNNHSRGAKQQKPHKHSFPIFLPQELCRPVGRHKWLMMGLAAPTIVWRLQSYMVALEARGVMRGVIDACLVADSATTNDEEFKPKPEPNLDVKPALLVEALTPRMGREIVDLERLEMLGDSLLKFVTSVEVFRVFPTKHEGFLTSKRAQLISNQFLIEAAHRFGLQKFVRGFPLCNGRHHLSVRPAGMSFDAIVQGRSIWSANVVAGVVVANKRVEDLAMASDEPTDFQHLEIRKAAQAAGSEREYYASLFPHAGYEAVALNPKVVADTMEALIGAYYTHGGIGLAVTVIKALGAWPRVSQEPEAPKAAPAAATLIAAKGEADKFVQTYSSNEEIVFPADYPQALQRIALGRVRLTESMLDKEQNLIHTDALEPQDAANEEPVVESDGEDREEKRKPRRAKVGHPALELISGNSLAMVSDLQKVVDELEAILGYRFRHWNVLEEALTHCSMQSAKNNQRLEFLGDAVLDLAVVTLLFDSQPWATQGDLSFQKSEATSNRNLGTVATQLQLYRFLRHNSMAMEMEFATVLAAVQRTSDAAQTAASESSAPSAPALGGFAPALSSKQPNLASLPTTKAEAVELQILLPPLQGGVEGPATKKASTATVAAKKRTVRMSASALKALADMFEALVGAIFLDSGGTVDAAQVVVRHIGLLPQLSIGAEGST